ERRKAEPRHVTLPDRRPSQVGEPSPKVPDRGSVHAADGVSWVELQLGGDADPAGDPLDGPLQRIRGLPAADRGVGTAGGEASAVVAEGEGADGSAVGEGRADGQGG